MGCSGRQPKSKLGCSDLLAGKQTGGTDAVLRNAWQEGWLKVKAGTVTVLQADAQACNSMRASKMTVPQELTVTAQNWAYTKQKVPEYVLS